MQDVSTVTSQKLKAERALGKPQREGVSHSGCSSQAATCEHTHACGAHAHLRGREEPQAARGGGSRPSPGAELSAVPRATATDMSGRRDKVPRTHTESESDAAGMPSNQTSNRKRLPSVS